MSRILLSAPVDKAWRTGPHLETALSEIGCEVLLFDFRSAVELDTQLLNLAEKYKPLVHIIWKGEKYKPQTLQQLSRKNIYNVLWHPDEILPNWLPKLAAVSDLVCLQSRSLLPKLSEAGVRNAEWLMQGLTPSLFHYGALSPADYRKFACDVVLIGSVNRKAGYGRRLDAINRLAREKIDVRWWGRHLPVCLNTLRDWLSPAARAWGGSPVWNVSYAKACHCAKIFLAYPLFPNLAGGLSSRAFMVTGVGTFYLSLYKAGMEELFEFDKEIVVFHDDDEMLDKVRYYLHHDSQRKSIARAGQLRCLRDYTNQKAFRRLFNLIADRGGPRCKINAQE